MAGTMPSGAGGWVVRGADSWEAWWAAIGSVPALSDALERRKSVWQGKSPAPDLTLGYQLETLRSAGFRETGSIWQYLDDYVVFAVR